MTGDHAMVRLWRWPIALAALTIVGLLAALLGGDGAARWLCWIALAAPLGIVMRVLSPGPNIRMRR